jgi:enoyl-CoA hydratase/carnithine racemase
MNLIAVQREPSGLAWVVLDRPARRNALTLTMWRELRDRLAELGAADDVRVIVLAGSGEHFCAGADIGEFEDARSTVADAQQYEEAVDACTETLYQVAKPTIAAIRGFCLGGGCGLAMACDFRLAHTSARFAIPAARLGIVYGVRDTQNLLALVGLAGAKRLLFTARQIDAAEAARIGLADEVVDGSVEDAARALAATLAENAPLSIAGAKLILTALVRGETREKRPEIEAALARSVASADYREGVRAFAEKRRPIFTGR